MSVCKSWELNAKPDRVKERFPDEAAGPKGVLQLLMLWWRCSQGRVSLQGSVKAKGPGLKAPHRL